MANLYAQLQALKVPTSCLPLDLQRRDLAKALVALQFAGNPVFQEPIEGWDEFHNGYEPEAA